MSNVDESAVPRHDENSNDAPNVTRNDDLVSRSPSPPYTDDTNGPAREHTPQGGVSRFPNAALTAAEPMVVDNGNPGRTDVGRGHHGGPAAYANPAEHSEQASRKRKLSDVGGDQVGEKERGGRVWDECDDGGHRHGVDPVPWFSGGGDGPYNQLFYMACHPSLAASASICARCPSPPGQPRLPVVRLSTMSLVHAGSTVLMPSFRIGLDAIDSIALTVHLKPHMFGLFREKVDRFHNARSSSMHVVTTDDDNNETRVHASVRRADTPIAADRHRRQPAKHRRRHRREAPARLTDSVSENSSHEFTDETPGGSESGGNDSTVRLVDMGQSRLVPIRMSATAYPLSTLLPPPPKPCADHDPLLPMQSQALVPSAGTDPVHVADGRTLVPPKPAEILCQFRYAEARSASFHNGQHAHSAPAGVDSHRRYGASGGENGLHGADGNNNNAQWAATTPPQPLYMSGGGDPYAVTMTLTQPDASTHRSKRLTPPASYVGASHVGFHSHAYLGQFAPPSPSHQQRGHHNLNERTSGDDDPDYRYATPPDFVPFYLSRSLSMRFQ